MPPDGSDAGLQAARGRPSRVVRLPPLRNGRQIPDPPPPSSPMPMRPQNYANHRRWFPLYHFVVAPLLVLNGVFAFWHARRIPTRWNWWTAVMSVVIGLGFVAARAMALRAQDRTIRLEMRVRFAQLLPADVATRARTLPTRMLIALRFAGDAELPGLVSRCLAGEFASPDQVKRAITDWQPDWLRV